MNVIDILTEAVTSMAFFSPKFIKMEIHFMMLIDTYKKMERSSMIVFGTKSGKHAHDRTSKMPGIVIPVCDGKIAEANTYMKEVKLTFQVQGAGESLTNQLVCTENLQWSHAFMANIAQSIMLNGKLSHLAIDVEGTNGAKYYASLIATVYTRNNSMNMMNTAWRKPLLPVTEDKTFFITLYSNFTKHLKTLTAGNIPIAKDNSFILCIYMMQFRLIALKCFLMNC